jgi:hypothetical protein
LASEKNTAIAVPAIADARGVDAVGFERLAGKEFHQTDAHEARAGAEQECQEDHVELRCAEHLPGFQVDCGVAGCGRGRLFTLPAGGLPAVGREYHPRPADDDGYEERHAVDDERGSQTDVFDQVAPRAGELHPQHRAETKSRDGQPRDHPFFVGKPAHTHSDRHHVGKTDTGTADDADADEQDRKRHRAEQAGKDVPESEHYAARNGQFSGADLGHHAAGDHHDDCEQCESGGEDGLRLGTRPARFDERLGEYRPGVDRSQ